MNRSQVPTFRIAGASACTANGTRTRIRPTAQSVGLGMLAAGLFVLHILLVHRYQTTGQMGITLVCYAAVGLLLRRRVHRMSLRSGPIPTALGWVLVGVLLAYVASYSGAFREFVYLYPVVAGLGLSFGASGFSGPRQHWRELTILFFLGMPRWLVREVVDIAPITAKVGSFWLWYFGQDVRLVGDVILLPGGSVVVDKECDGVGTIAYLACLAVVYLMLFPTGRFLKVAVPAVALLTAFFTNSIRVAILAAIEASDAPRAFDFWHHGPGSVIWILLPVFLFGLFCLFAGPTRRTVGGKATPAIARAQGAAYTA